MAEVKNDNLEIRSPKDVDKRRMKFVGGKQVPYASATEANTLINPAYRYPYLTVMIGTQDNAQEWWYVGDVQNDDLQPKPAGSRPNNINVLDFGADVTGVAPSSTAINSAITAAIASRTGVFLPAGTYNINAPINYHYLVPLEGAGRMSTILKATSAVPVIQRVNGDTIEQPGNNISNLQIDGNGIGTIGINIRGVFGFSIIDCYVHNFTVAGVNIKGTVGLNFETCVFQDMPIGVKSDEVTQSTNDYVPGNWIKFNNCGFYFCTQWAIDWRTGAMVAITDSDFEINGSLGNLNTGCIHMHDHAGADEGVGLIIKTTWFERNRGTIILIDNPRGATSHKISDSLLQYSEAGATNAGIVVRGTAGIDQKLILVNSKVVGQTTDVVADGVDVAIYTQFSQIGTTSTVNGGVVSGSGDGAWTSIDSNNIHFGGPTNHTLAIVEALNTNPIVGAVAGIEVKSGAGSRLRMQANSTETFLGTITNHALSFYANSIKRMELPPNGGVILTEFIGQSSTKALNIDTSGKIVLGDSTTASWIATDANTLKFTAPDSHALIIAESTNGISVAGYETKSAGGVRSRMQSNSTLAFMGTITNHDFEITANSVSRINLPAAGGIKFPVLTGSVDELVGIHADGSLYRTPLGSNLLVASNSNNLLTYTGTADHTILKVVATGTDKSGGIELDSSTGVGVRVQANYNGGFIGTTTAHPFSIYANATERMIFPSAGGILIKDVPEHADNAAAVTAGLQVERLYHTGGVLKIVTA